MEKWGWTKGNTRIFREEQRFRQTWVWVLIVITSVIVWSSTIQQILFNNPIGNKPVTDSAIIILWIIFGIFFPIFFYKLKLTTEVRKKGIYIRFFPLQLKFKRIGFERLKKYEIRTYNPILEYGGWGIRHGFKGKAYNVSGNLGIQMEFKNGKRLLIGSQKPEDFYRGIKDCFKNAGKDLC